MYVCMYACMHVCMYACMHVCMYACMHACMHACMYACIHIGIDLHLFLNIYGIYAVEIIDDSCLRCSSERQGASHIVVFGGKGRKR